MTNRTATLSRKSTVARVAFAAFILMALSAVSLLPHFGLDYTQFDKLVHVAAFMVVTSLFIMIFSLSGRLIAILISISVLYEIAQNFVPTRSADFGDGVANVIGVILAASLFMIFDHLKPARRR